MSTTTARYGTPFVETEALLAMGEGDEEYLDQIMRSMLPTERAAFVRNLLNLLRYVEFWEPELSSQ